MYLSGGAGNTDPNASLGGVISTTEVIDATIANLYDNVSSSEALAGDVEYRCVYVKNTHATLTLQTAKVFIQTNTPSADTAVRIGLGTAAINATEQTVVNESTAPIGVTFATAINEGAALLIGDLVPGAQKALWYERTVIAGAAAYNADSVIVQLKGDTAA